MKPLYIIFTLFITSTLHAAGPQPLPKNWYELNNSEINLKFKTKLSKLEKFGTYLTGLYDTQEDVLKGLDQQDLNNTSSWKFSAYRTDLVLSSSGLLGFSSLTGKSVAELFWTRVKKNKKLMQEPKALNSIELNNLLSEKDLEKQLGPIIKIAISSGKVKDEKKMRESLMKKAKEIHAIMGALTPQIDSNWVPFKFRIDLSFGVSGNLLSVTNLGGKFRVRLEWAIKKRTDKSQKNLFSIFRSKRKKRIKNFQKLIRHLGADAEKATEGLTQQSGYRLAAINFGMALTQKSFFGLASSKATTVGLIFFKKISVKRQLKTKNSLDGEYTLVPHSKHEQKLFSPVFKRKRFRKGLKKAIKIASYFASRAKKNTAKKNGHWLLKKIRVAFVLSYSGIFGLSNTSAAGIHNIILVKN